MIITGKALRQAKASGDPVSLALNKASMKAKLEGLEKEIRNCIDTEKREKLQKEYQEDMQALKEV